MAREHLLHRVGDLADRRPGADRVDRQLEQVGVAGRALGQPLQRLLHASVVARLAQLPEAGDLLFAHGGVVDGADLDVVVAVGPILVDADDDLFTLVDAGLATCGCLLDAQLRHPRLDRLGHAAELLDLVDELRRLVRERVRQRLDVVAAAERVDDVGDAGLLGEDQLRVAGDPGRELRRQRERLVERVRVQALRAAERGRHRLVGRADDVVVRVVLGERDARRLAVRPQHHRARLGRAELPDQLRPQEPRRPQLGDLHEEVHADRKEEGETPGEGVDVEARDPSPRARTPRRRRS